MKVTQQKIIHDHLLKYGKITSMEAIEKYRITRLRKKGVDIITTMKTVETQYGKEEIAVYTLEI